MITSILDTALSDPRVTIGSLALAAISAAGLVAREWIRKSKHAANNKRMIEVNEREARAAEAKARADLKIAELEAAPTLIDKIEKLWAEKDECKEALRKAAFDRERERLDDAARCAQETARQVEEATAPLRSTIAAMVEREAAWRESQHGEDTGVHVLRAQAAEVRRTPTPPGDTPAQPERRGELMPRTGVRSLRDIPPPKRGKGD